MKRRRWIGTVERSMRGMDIPSTSNEMIDLNEWQLDTVQGGAGVGCNYDSRRHMYRCCTYDRYHHLQCTYRSHR